MSENLPTIESRRDTTETNPLVLTLLRQAEEARASNILTRAYACYARATELDPKHPDAWAGRAATAPDLDDAITSWGCAVALSPGNPQARAALEDSINRKINSSDMSQVPSLVVLGRNLAQVGQKPWAYRLFQRATEIDDTNEQAWVWRAGLTEDLNEMISSLNKVLAINPDNQQAQAGLKWAMSLHDGQVPISSVADQAVRLVEEGKQLLDRGEKDHAHDLFRRATELDPNNEQAWLWRGSSTSEVDEALDCMEQALGLNPENESAREARSWLRIKKLRSSPRSQEPIPEVPAPVSPGVPRPDHSALFKQLQGPIIAILVFVLLVLLTILFMKLSPFL